MKYNDVHKVIGKHMLADGMSPVIDLEKSHGSWLVDGSNGDEYLDLFSITLFESDSPKYIHTLPFSSVGIAAFPIAFV